MALAIIGLVQAVGVSKTVPNADGNFPDASRDFAGQGLANIASGFVQGLPIGGTMGETSVKHQRRRQNPFRQHFFRFRHHRCRAAAGQSGGIYRHAHHRRPADGGRV